jgi:hypothetical protein
MVNTEEMGKMYMDVFSDRGVKKIRVNIVRGNVIGGFIKPV